MYGLIQEGWLCPEPAISLHSHHVSLVQWGDLCEAGILLLALSRYSCSILHRGGALQQFLYGTLNINFICIVSYIL
jgi:hypothetical protein